MSQSNNIVEVGAQNPELSNSPVALESDEEYEVIRQEVDGQQVCYFNGQSFENGCYVRSGPSLLVCDRGLWVNAGSSDPDNP